MRLFFAIPLPEDLKAELACFQRVARASVDRASWPDPGGLHLTLAFMGEMEEASVKVLFALASACGGVCSGFGLRTSHLGGFPQSHAARVLWLGLEEEPALVKLCEELRRNLRAADVAFDEKPFKPHLTLARFKNPVDIRCFGDGPRAMDFEVRELVLCQSLRTPEGTQYRALGVQRLW